MMESSPASRHHSGSCASPALVMMAALFFSLSVSVRDEP
jgi:hypothetical protein